MTRILINGGIGFILAFLGTQQIVAQWTEPEWAILRRAIDAIQSEEGGVFISGVFTAPPLLPEQLGVATATWNETFRNGETPSIRVGIDVFAIATPEAASGFFDDRPIAQGWVRELYNLGDEARLSTHLESGQLEIHFRVDRFIVFVSGLSQEDVERVARYVFRAATDR